MGEEATGGLAPQVTVNFDIDKLSNKIDELSKILSGDKNTVIKDIAIKLYANTNFESVGKSPYQVAQDAVGKAQTLVSVFESNNLL